MPIGGNIAQMTGSSAMSLHCHSADLNFLFHWVVAYMVRFEEGVVLFDEILCVAVWDALEHTGCGVRCTTLEMQR